jgi:hypothetical protein
VRDRLCLGAIEDCASFLIGKGAQQVTKRAREALASWNVTPVQYAVLKTLWYEDNQTSAAIGSVAVSSPSHHLISR